MDEASSGDGEPGTGTRDAGRTDVTRSVADDVGAFSTVVGFFYRGEMDRVTTWRTRLDQTTNWAVIVMVGILTWVFSSPDHPHYVLLIGMGAVGVFLFIEAHRFQEYDAWRSRLREVQRDFVADVFRSSDRAHEDWRARVSRDLREPEVELSLARALGHRLQRVYFPLLSVLLVAWVVRITVFTTGVPWYDAATVGTLPGRDVATAVGAAYLALLGLTLWSVRQVTERGFDGGDPSDARA